LAAAKGVPEQRTPGEVVEGKGREKEGGWWKAKEERRMARTAVARAQSGRQEKVAVAACLKVEEEGKGKNGITSTRRSWWRKGLACEAPMREIGRRWRQPVLRKRERDRAQGSDVEEKRGDLVVYL
jgi:hypothetical protein